MDAGLNRDLRLFIDYAWPWLETFECIFF